MDILSECLGTHQITVAGDTQKIESKDYNCLFNFATGYMERCGCTTECDDTPPIPEVVDVEVTTACEGVSTMTTETDEATGDVTVSDYYGPKSPCKYCYKSNNPAGSNMSLETFKTVFDKFPESVNQIAFSADSTLKANPALFEMMDYCYNNPQNNIIIPSISVAQLERKEAEKLIDSYIGCVGVSMYENKEVCYDTAKLLLDVAKEKGRKTQVNLQVVVGAANFDHIMGILDDIKVDPRLEAINCIVYLSLKQKGRGAAFELLSDEKWLQLLDKTMKSVEFFGVDVCSTGKLQAYSQGSEETRDVEEPCEAGYYSMYINKEGEMFPCSFLENTPDWEGGCDLLTEDFADIWLGERFLKHRESIKAIRSGECTGCPYWEI